VGRLRATTNNRALVAVNLAFGRGRTASGHSFLRNGKRCLSTTL
jgi:hypothetical protein